MGANLFSMFASYGLAGEIIGAKIANPIIKIIMQAHESVTGSLRNLDRTVFH